MCLLNILNVAIKKQFREIQIKILSVSKYFSHGAQFQCFHFQPGTHPLIGEEKQKPSLFLTALQSFKKCSLRIPSLGARTVRERVDSGSYLPPPPLPMSRLGVLLLQFLAHLSFRSGKFRQARGSRPESPHPNPGQRVTASRPKSI